MPRNAALKRRYVPTQSMKEVERQYKKLPPDMKTVVDAIMAKSDAKDHCRRRLWLQEAVHVVVRKVECQQKCCRTLTREERLASLLS